MARVAMVAFTHYTGDSRVRREAEALVQRGDTVDVIALQEEGMGAEAERNGVRVVPVRVSRYRGNSGLSYIIQYLDFFVRGCIKLTTLHLKHRYQIVQVHTMPDFMVFVAMVPRLLGAKVILDVHDLMPELYMCKFGVSAKHPIIRLLTAMERWSVAFAHRAIAVHEPHRDALLSHGCRDKFITLLNVPDRGLFGERREGNGGMDGAFRLIYHGTIARRHGLEVAIRGIALLREEVPEIRLDVIGEGDDRDRLVELVSALKLDDHVQFSDGRVALEELPARICEADLGIVPLLDDPFTRFMLPVKMLEYMGLGVPVIASNTETIRHYCTEKMVAFCVPGDVEDFADRVLELYRDPAQRQALVVNANAFSDQMTWQGEREKYYALVDSLS